MSSPLLSTKFNIPPTSGIFVPRPHLTARLTESLREEVLLTLVCGPAGYGKTVLVSDWLQGLSKTDPAQFSWLTLERSDDDLTRFLSYFVAALQRIRPGIGQGVLKLLQSHKSSPPTVPATLLINEISEIFGRFFLILDDYHLLTTEAIHDFMRFLVDHQPSQLCLVLLTRADPPLPLARLRARGQVVELRQEELRFSTQEAAEFVDRATGIKLSPAQLALLQARTEGWIAGLQLAALSMRNAPDRQAFLQTVSGEHGFIADYLTDEVLVHLPEHLRAFLLQTSILGRLSAPLCEAVTGQAGALAILEHITESNLFITPLDNQHTWFRYHALFADLLHKRLQAVQGDLVSDLHRRASQWYQENGLLELAIEHAISASDYEQAARWIEQIADGLLMRGEIKTIKNWLEVLPGAFKVSHPILGALYGFVLLTSGGSIQPVSALLQEMEAAGALERVQGEVTTLRALLNLMQGKAVDAIQLSEQALQQLPAQRPFFRSLAADGLGMGYTLAGDVPAAVQGFELVLQISAQTGNTMMNIMALTNLAGLHYLQGHLRAAIAICREGLELARTQIGAQTPLVGKTLFTLAGMLREQGDLQAALGHLQEAARLFEHFNEIGLPLAYLSLARVKLDQKDWPAAQAYIDQARQMARTTRSTQIDDRLVEVMQARHWIAQGELGRVIQWAQELGLLGKSPAELLGEGGRNAALNELLQSEYVTLVRLFLAQQQPDQAVAMLDLLQEASQARGYQRRLVEILALKALALEQKGLQDQALQALDNALSLAEPEGYQRIFLDQGEPMARLLYQAAARQIHPAYAGWLLKAFAAEDTTELVTTTEAERLIEPLSDRELEVLKLVAAGLSNAEIARRLFISLSTVKGHTANIFGKLSVNKRTQAASRARSLGLLPPD